MNIALDIARLELRLEKLRNIANFADLTPGRFPQNLIKNHIAAIKTAIDGLDEDLTARKSISLINSGRARHQSVVAALASWAREVGSAIVRFDSALAMVQTHCPEEHRGFWAAQSPGLIAGLVANEMKDSEFLKAEGCLVFLADPDDGYIRIVDTNTSAHADIYRRVTEWRGGRRCRACRIEEPPMSLELQAVDAEQRNAYNTIGGAAQLQLNVVYTHKQCRLFWLSLVRIAEKYSSLAEAVAADLSAGRVSRASRQMPDFKPDAPPSAPSGGTPTRADQGDNPPSKRKDRMEDGRG
jgi:hypothetical protein